VRAERGRRREAARTVEEEGAPRSGGGAEPLGAGIAREAAEAAARDHGPRVAGVGPRGPSTGSGRRGGAARPVEIIR
jgi:hypothetical protein